jgi:hypothetical protein
VRQSEVDRPGLEPTGGILLIGAHYDSVRCCPAANGMRRATGPFSLSINDETGLLIDGFDTPPSMMIVTCRATTGRGLRSSAIARRAI